MKLVPGLSGAYSDRGLAHLQCGSLDTRWKILLPQLVSIRCRHTPTTIALSLGESWGKPKRALAGLSNAIQLITGHVGALNNRGEVLADLGRTEEAAADSRNVLALDPSHSRAAENLRRLEREIAGKP